MVVLFCVASLMPFQGKRYIVRRFVCSLALPLPPFNCLMLRVGEDVPLSVTLSTLLALSVCFFSDRTLRSHPGEQSYVNDLKIFGSFFLANVLPPRSRPP